MKKLVCLLALVITGMVCACGEQKSGEISLMTQEEMDLYCALMVGSDTASLHYASDDDLIFGYGKYLFTYDMEEGKIDKAINLGNLPISTASQGSVVLGVEIDDDGEKALVKNYGYQAEDVKKYMIDLETGIIWETKRDTIKDKFKGLRDTFSLVKNPVGWYSGSCVEDDGKVYYTTIENIAIMGNLQLVEYDIKTGNSQQKYIFGKQEIPKTVEVLLREIEASGENTDDGDYMRGHDWKYDWAYQTLTGLGDEAREYMQGELKAGKATGAKEYIMKKASAEIARQK